MSVWLSVFPNGPALVAAGEAGWAETIANIVTGARGCDPDGMWLGFLRSYFFIFLFFAISLCG
jgi:hypothetical protein